MKACLPINQCTVPENTKLLQDNCSHVANIEKDTKFNIPSTIKDMFKVYCRNIIPYMYLYKHQMEYYEKTVYNILEKDIGLILPKFVNTVTNGQLEHPKRQIISALIR